MTSPEATAGYHFRDGLVQTTWSSTRTSKLLLEAGWSYTFGSWPTFLQPNTSESDVAIIDIGKGFTYNANPSYTGRIGQDLAGAQPRRPVWRACGARRAVILVPGWCR